MGYLIDILVGVVSGIVTGELSAHVGPLAQWIIGRAAQRLRAGDRARYHEEWLAHLDETPGTLRKLWHALGCHLCAAKVAGVLAQRTERTAASEPVIVTEDETDVETLLAALVYARRASVETNERFLRRLGADLHDGPAQLIGLALLRIERLGVDHSKSSEIENIRAVLQDCLREIRHLSANLAPPHLDSLPLRKVLELAVRQHEQRTETVVKATIGTLPECMSPLLKVCIYRFVQEGLNNAYRHAGGAGQTVQVIGSSEELSIEVADSGPGFCSSNSGNGDGLGLAGLRDRVETLGGKFSLETQLGSGTKVRGSFPMSKGYS
jgi:signal transduction histidine kinase